MAKMLSNYNVYATRELLQTILSEVLCDERIMFLCDSGRGVAVVQKTRVMLSRLRDQLKRERKPLRRFTLHSTIHAHTDTSGKRHDCIVMWATRGENHQLGEALDDLLGRELLS
jgi:hypothetical protein